MGTSNFHNVNAKKVYSVGLENDENDDSDLLFLSDLKEDIRSIIETKKGGIFSVGEAWQKSMYELRSFPSTYLGTIESVKRFVDIEVIVEVRAFLRAGYYEGANLDYEIFIYFNCSDFYDKVENISVTDVLLAMEHEDIQRAKILHKKVINWINKEIERLSNQMEQVFESVCDSKLQVFARFSNGETWYNEAK